MMFYDDELFRVAVTPRKWCGPIGNGTSEYVMKRAVDNKIKKELKSAEKEAAKAKKLAPKNEKKESKKARKAMAADRSDQVAPTVDMMIESAVEVLPIDKYRADILQRVESERVTVIEGGTGCGKSSRLPVMLLQDAERKGLPSLIMVRLREQPMNYIRRCRSLQYPSIESSQIESP